MFNFKSSKCMSIDRKLNLSYSKGLFAIVTKRVAVYFTVRALTV